jgi:hypothetical protein
MKNALQHELPAFSPSTATWLQSTLLRDYTFPDPTTALDAISNIASNVDRYDLNNVSRVQDPWSSVFVGLGSITQPFVSPGIQYDSTEYQPPASELWNSLAFPDTFCRVPDARLDIVQSTPFGWKDRNDSTGEIHKKGRRVKPLNPAVKSKAAVVRRNRACWRCRLQHLSVSQWKQCAG